MEKIAIADAAFEACGKTLEELFVNCAKATFEAMVDFKTVTPNQVEKLKLENKTLEDLLFDWLAELIYLKDYKAMLFKEFSVKIQKNTNYVLEGEAKGEAINQNKHNLRADVKAVTYHLFEIKKSDRLWRAKVILDI
ncbi:MAG: hypothetical protein A2V73_02075 [candidate division Zixibacteria bacterium RBG_19FT_COMBO_42_43]|nr:MAG: hypothetical protein A2V73_02075 [candidate division Zixibacteria bacterium RBG_19FT_COMBO_42_43]